MQSLAARRPAPESLPPKVGPEMDLERFIRIQDQPLRRGTEYRRAIQELRGGRKLNHWMWFIFPRVYGLDKQVNDRLYGIKSVDEARFYLTHPILGPRLRQTTEAALASGEKDLTRLFGGELDAAHFKSSMTLFAWISLRTDNEFFLRVMKKLWDGTWDERTLRILKKWEDERRVVESNTARFPCSKHQ